MVSLLHFILAAVSDSVQVQFLPLLLLLLLLLLPLLNHIIVYWNFKVHLMGPSNGALRLHPPNQVLTRTHPMIAIKTQVSRMHCCWITDHSNNNDFFLYWFVRSEEWMALVGYCWLVVIGIITPPLYSIHPHLNLSKCCFGFWIAKQEWYHLFFIVVSVQGCCCWYWIIVIVVLTSTTSTSMWGAMSGGWWIVLVVGITPPLLLHLYLRHEEEDQH